MALVKVKPTSPGRRAVIKVVTPGLHKGAPVAGLIESQSKHAGRNNNGHITTRHKGGGHKQHYRMIDFKRNKDGFLRRWSASNTIPTVPRRLLWHLIIRKWSNFSWRFGLPWEFQQTIIVNNILPTKNEFNLPDTILYLPEHKINLRDLFQSCEFHDFKLKSVTIQTNDSIFVQNEKVKFQEDIIYFTLDIGE